MGKALVRIMIVDNQPLMRLGICSILGTRPDWNVCGEADSAASAMPLIGDSKPELVIADLALKDGSGLELVKRIVALTDAPRILVFTMHDTLIYAERAMHAGAKGYVHKTETAERLLHAVDQVLSGHLVAPEAVISALLKRGTGNSDSPIAQLTDRELEILECIGRGMSINQIATSLFLSPKTVETYRDRAKKKLNLRTANDYFRYAVNWAQDKTS